MCVLAVECNDNDMVSTQILTQLCQLSMKAAGGVSKKPEELKFFGNFAVLVYNIQSRPPRGIANKFTSGSISSSICQPLLKHKFFANRRKILLRKSDPKKAKI